MRFAATHPGARLEPRRHAGDEGEAKA